MSIPFNISPMGNYLLEAEYVDFGAGDTRYWFIVPPLNASRWTGVQLELKLVNLSNTAGAVFGYEKDASTRTFFRYNNAWQLYTGKVYPTYTFDYPAGSEISLSVNYATGSIMVNGEKVSATAAAPYTWGSWCIGDCSYNIDGTFPWGTARNKMYMYSFKLWNNAELLYDLQPMIDRLGRYWMRNMVDGTLLTRYERA